MKVGITRSVADITHGGIFQYEKALLDALSEIALPTDSKLVYLSYLDNDLNTLAHTGNLQYRGLPVEIVNRPAPPQDPVEAYIDAEPASYPPIDPDQVFFDRTGSDRLRSAGIDLVLQLSPSSYTFSLGLPFIMPIFDLNHRLQPEFPEVSAYGQYELREYFYINTCRFATMVLVDSEVGKSDVLRFYGDYIDEERIRIVPYYPPIVRTPMPDADQRARVAAKYGLPDRYFFYPAQFWRHKNHILILRALQIIGAEHDDVIPVVFCGAYSDYHRALNFKEIMDLATELGLGDRVRYIGSVPEDDMSSLFAMSAGLVMPTFFGPTNIPPFEAWHYGRPVISSNIPGIREQIGDAGLLVDPRSPAELAEALLKIWRDAALVETLVEAGQRRLDSYRWTTFVEGVSGAITDACSLVRSGRSPKFPDIPAPTQPIA